VNSVGVIGEILKFRLLRDQEPSAAAYDYSKGLSFALDRTQLLLHKCRALQAEELQVGFSSAAAYAR